MGSDKAAVVLGDHSLAYHVTTALGDCLAHVSLVLHDGAASAPADVTRPLLRDHELWNRHLMGVEPVRAPIVGVAVALAAARAPWVLVTACDMPNLSASVLLGLLSLAADSTAYDVVIPIGEHGPEPLLAIYRRRLLPRVLERIAAGQLGLKSLVTQCERVEVPLSILAQIDASLECLANVNDPEDLRRVEAARGRRERG